MNKDNAKDFLPLVQALAEGKTIQLNDHEGGWISLASVDFSLTVDSYRIKPEKKTGWIVIDSNGWANGPYSVKQNLMPSELNKAQIQITYEEGEGLQYP